VSAVKPKRRTKVTHVFRIYDWNFSSTIELVVAALLATTLLAVILVL
jgi:hypothetical protein